MSFELDDHSRTIIHIDIDCFYAQVEMNKNPELRNVPLGIQQKHLVVTSNYKARELGIKKMMLLTEARKLCPQLVLANGEDLHDYRQVSYLVTSLVQRYTNLVERLGLDENYLDVTDLVKQRLSKEANVAGHIFGDFTEEDSCNCGCYQNLKVGSLIADEIRTHIKNELNLTTCAGIAHNKLIAKIVGKSHKPNQQTVIFPNNVQELMLSLQLSEIPGIGRMLLEQLQNLNLNSVKDLQDGYQKLEEGFGCEKARTIYNLSYGIDKTAVKVSGKPQTISLEDSCRTISVEIEVKKKLEQLLNRLLLLVTEDGRIPKTIKLTVRKLNKDSKNSQRETKQCNINPGVFNAPQKESKIMTTVMHLFSRIIDVKKPYHITLLGISFTKFQEKPNSRQSIASFLRKNLEVQSLTSFEKNSSEECITVAPSTSYCSLEGDSPSPSPKRLKLAPLLVRKRYLEEVDCESPSKLKVADLSLENICCPPEVDEEVFKELPLDVQKELWEDFQQRRLADQKSLQRSVKLKSKQNVLLNYFIRNK